MTSGRALKRASSASSETRCSSTLTIRSMRPFKANVPLSNNSTASPIANQLSPSACVERTSRPSSSAAAIATSGNGCHGVAAASRCCCRYATPPLSLLPYTSIGACPDHRLAVSAAGLSRSPPDETMQLSCEGASPTTPGSSLFNWAGLLIQATALCEAAARATLDGLCRMLASKALPVVNGSNTLNNNP